MYIVRIKLQDTLNCEEFVMGPFADYDAAENYLHELPVAQYCDHKFIQELTDPEVGADLVRDKSVETVRREIVDR